MFQPFYIGVEKILQYTILNISNKLLAHFAGETKMLLPVFQMSTQKR